MKKLVPIILVSTLLVGSGCNKFLDVQPKQVFGENLAITSFEGLQKVTTGAFDGIQSGGLYGGGIIATSELLGDWIDAQHSWATFLSTNLRGIN